MATRKRAIAPIKELRVEIRFEGLRSIPVVLACEVLERVNDLVGQAERADLLFFQEQFPEVPATIFDAAMHRMAAFRSNADLDGLREGSIILELTPTSIALGMITLAAAETFKEAWIKSGLHKKLVDLLSRSLMLKAESIVKEAKNMELHKTGQVFEAKPAIDALVTQREDAVVATIVVKADEKIYQALTPSEALEVVSNEALEESSDRAPNGRQ